MFNLYINNTDKVLDPHLSTMYTNNTADSALKRENTEHLVGEKEHYTPKGTGIHIMGHISKLLRRTHLYLYSLHQRSGCNLGFLRIQLNQLTIAVFTVSLHASQYFFSLLYLQISQNGIDDTGPAIST